MKQLYKLHSFQWYDLNILFHVLKILVLGHIHQNSIEIIKGKPQIVSDDNASGGYLDIDFLKLEENHLNKI